MFGAVLLVPVQYNAGMRFNAIEPSGWKPASAPAEPAPEPLVKTTTKNVAGYNMVIHDAYDSEHKVYWDEKISRESIVDDCYQLRQLVADDPGIDSVIDIGGHIGSFAVIANTFWPKAEIKCFEPLLENFELLKMNTDHIKQKVSAFNQAVAGIAAKEVRFQPSSLSIKEHGKLNTGDAKLDCMGSMFAETTTVSAIMAGKPCGLLKMDCEESELEILAEACRMYCLGKIKHIRMEVHSEAYLAAIEGLLKKTHKMAVMSAPAEQLYVVKADLLH